MTDRDHSLQDAFDRHFRGDGPPPDADDPDAAAYEVVFSALHEEPEGDLPADFAEQVADRVGMRTEPALAWSDVLLLLLAMVAPAAAAVLFPSLLAPFESALATIGRSVQALGSQVRLDVVLSVALALAIAAGLDALLARWRPFRRAPTPSS